MAREFTSGSEGYDRQTNEKFKEMQSKIDSLEYKIDLLMKMLERHFPSENIIKELEQEVNFKTITIELLEYVYPQDSNVSNKPFKLILNRTIVLCITSSTNSLANPLKKVTSLSEINFGILSYIYF